MHWWCLFCCRPLYVYFCPRWKRTPVYAQKISHASTLSPLFSTIAWLQRSYKNTQKSTDAVLQSCSHPSTAAHTQIAPTSTVLQHLQSPTLKTQKFPFFTTASQFTTYLPHVKDYIPTQRSHAPPQHSLSSTESAHKNSRKEKIQRTDSRRRRHETHPQQRRHTEENAMALYLV